MFYIIGQVFKKKKHFDWKYIVDLNVNKKRKKKSEKGDETKSVGCVGPFLGFQTNRYFTK